MKKCRNSKRSKKRRGGHCEKQSCVFAAAGVFAVEISQNHRIVGVGRDLERSLGPTPPAKAGSLEQAAQVGVQTGLEYLQRRTLHNLPGQPVSVLRHPHREEVLLHVGAELPGLHLVAITPCPVPTNH